MIRRMNAIYQTTLSALNLKTDESFESENLLSGLRLDQVRYLFRVLKINFVSQNFYYFLSLIREVKWIFSLKVNKKDSNLCYL